MNREKWNEILVAKTANAVEISLSYSFYAEWVRHTQSTWQRVYLLSPGRKSYFFFQFVVAMMHAIIIKWSMSSKSLVYQSMKRPLCCGTDSVRRSPKIQSCISEFVRTNWWMNGAWSIVLARARARLMYTGKHKMTYSVRGSTHHDTQSK